MTESQDSQNLPKIVDELLIDIYANTVLKSVVIMIDRPFQKTLTALEFDRRTSALLFIFGTEKRDLGAPLQKQLVPYFLDRNEIEVCQMDLQTRKPVAVTRVPLSVRE